MAHKEDLKLISLQYATDTSCLGSKRYECHTCTCLCLIGPMRYLENSVLLSECRCEVNGFNRLHERFGCRIDTGSAHLWRELRTILLYFAINLMLLIVSRIFNASNMKILYIFYSRHVKGTLVKTAMRPKNF